MPRKKRLASVQANEVIHTEGEERPFKPVTSLNEEQKELIKAIHHNSLIVAIGGPGTGKTYIGCGLAAEYLSRGLVDKIILTRASVGPENLGYLPGDVDSKLHPYMQPLFIELSNFLNVQKEMNKGRIEILPLAYMRGRTLRNSFVLMDEGQNTTTHQLKMFLTRMGENSKFMITADLRQSDLEGKHVKDFPLFVKKLEYIATPENEIIIVELLHSVRHPLVEKLLKLFEN